MEQLKEYHHFKKELISSTDRLAKCERYLVDMLLTSELPDSKRDSSICWELKHQASCRQFAAILALKRGLPIEVCLVGLLFHDVYSAYSGKYKEHAHRSAELTKQILATIGGFSDEELDQIWSIIYHHSDKHIWTEDPFKEFGKDVDVLDCFLYEGAFGYYLGNKPLPVFQEYLRRAKKVWVELGLPVDIRFNLLDDYGSSWFQLLRAFHDGEMKIVLAILFELSSYSKDQNVCPPPFCITLEDGIGSLYGNRRGWINYIENLAARLDDSAVSEKIHTAYPILSEIVKGDNSVSQSLPAIGHGVVFKESFREAENILLHTGSKSNIPRHMLLFWPLIDIYESLSGGGMLSRLGELGIKSGRGEK